MLRAATNDSELTQLERTGFGVSHDALGAAMCETWGLNPSAVASVRHHVWVQATGELPPELARRTICALSGIVHALMTQPASLDAVAENLAPQADLDPVLVLRAVRQVAGQLGLAHEHGRQAE